MNIRRKGRRGLLVFAMLGLVLPLEASENIALKADTILTSHVSPWEDLFTINNGIDPQNSGDKTGGAYGNWTGSDNNWQWVQYRWDSLYRISRSDVYWWADGQGIVIPYDTYQEYWDFLKGQWVELPDVQGNGTEGDRYNITSFTPVLTDGIRVHMISTIATGILEWRIWGEPGEQVPRGTSLEIDEELAKNDTSEILIVAKDADFNPVQGYTFVLDIKVTNNLATTDETYFVGGTEYSSDYLGIPLAPTDASGETAFRIGIPGSIDYRDGLSVQILFSDSLTPVGDAFEIFEPGLTPPTLSRDEDGNTVDQDIVLGFTDDADWRAAIYAVYADDSLLTPAADYEVLAGSITLKPAAGNPYLTKAGVKEIRVEAWGYEDNPVAQEILPGNVDTAESIPRTLSKLFTHTHTLIEVLARDRFGNPIRNYSFEYGIGITDDDPATDEVYTIAGMEASSDQSGWMTSPTDSNGRTTVSLVIPGKVDPDDGIEIIFKTEDGNPLSPSVSYVFDGTEKQVLVQRAVRNNPGFSWERTAQSDDFIIYWGDEINGDPEDREQNPGLWFDPPRILGWLEAIRERYGDSLGFLDTGGNDALFKHEVVMNETWSNGEFTGWAFGGGADNTIGGLWVHPNATRDDGVLAHEFTHSCQAMVLVDRPGYGLNTPYAGFFWESHANFMANTYRETRAGMPERFIYTAMMQYSVTRRHYQNLPFLDYLYDVYGMDTINKIWHNADRNRSHPLTSLRDSVLRYSQDDLNDDFIRQAMRNVSWDYEKTGEWWRRAMLSIPEYRLGRLYTILDTLKGEPGWYIVPEHLAPADYGYNIIPLYPDPGALEIRVDFRGLENEPAGGAGSRYGFVALDQEGTPRYSELYTEEDLQSTFPLDPSDSAVFMVVTGAPDQHHNYAWEVGYPKSYRYPYTVSFTGAVPAGHKPGYNSRKADYPGAPHPNGGGWVAATASVAETAWVGPNAQVLGSAVVSGNARIEGYAIVTDNARVRDDAVVKDHAIVYNNSNISGNALVEKTARIYNVRVNQNAVVSGSALLWNFTLNNDVIVKDLAILWDGSLSGTTLVGGDAEESSGCSSGTYLEFKRSSAGCDGRTYHINNVEVNPAWPEYAYPLGDKPGRPLNIEAGNLSDSTVELRWDEAEDDEGIAGYYVYRKRFSQVTGVGIARENQFTVTGLDADTYYSFFVQAFDRGGNLSLQSDTVEVKTAAAGTDEITYPGYPEVKVYPNPAGDYINIDLSTPGEARVMIYDLLGRVAYQASFRDRIRIECPEIGRGLYILEINAPSFKYRNKILIHE